MHFNKLSTLRKIKRNDRILKRMLMRQRNSLIHLQTYELISLQHLIGKDTVHHSFPFLLNCSTRNVNKSAGKSLSASIFSLLIWINILNSDLILENRKYLPIFQYNKAAVKEFKSLSSSSISLCVRYLFLKFTLLWVVTCIILQAFL